MKITRHFSYEEFLQSNTAKQKNILNYPSTLDAARVYDRIIRLANILQVARDYFDAPLRISSGYRCPLLNTAVGGVTKSKHLLGAAADIPYTEDTKSSIYAALVHANKYFDMEQAYVIRIIDEKGWYHIQLEDWVSNWSLMTFLHHYNSLLFKTTCATNS